MASLADLLAYSQNLAKKYTSLDTPQDQTLGETLGDVALGFAPVVGTAQGARDFERARREKDYLGMGLSAASMLPVVGGVVKAGRTATKASKIAKALEQTAPKAEPITLDVYRGTQFGPTKKNITFHSTNPLIAEGYSQKFSKLPEQYKVKSGDEEYMFDTLEEAQEAVWKLGGTDKITKLTSRPKVEKTTVTFQNPLIVDANQSNWNMFRNPFADPEKVKKYEKDRQKILSSKKELERFNGRWYSKQQRLDDLDRFYNWSIFTDTDGIAEQAKKRGHDGVIVKNVYDAAIPIDATNEVEMSKYLGDTVIKLKK